MCYFKTIAFSHNSMPRSTKLFVHCFFYHTCCILKLEKEILFLIWFKLGSNFCSNNHFKMCVISTEYILYRRFNMCLMKEKITIIISMTGLLLGWDNFDKYILTIKFQCHWELTYKQHFIMLCLMCRMKWKLDLVINTNTTEE